MPSAVHRLAVPAFERELLGRAHRDAGELVLVQARDLARLRAVGARDVRLRRRRQRRLRRRHRPRWALTDRSSLL